MAHPFHSETAKPKPRAGERSDFLTDPSEPAVLKPTLLPMPTNGSEGNVVAKQYSDLLKTTTSASNDFPIKAFSTQPIPFHVDKEQKKEKTDNPGDNHPNHDPGAVAAQPTTDTHTLAQAPAQPTAKPIDVLSRNENSNAAAATSMPRNTEGAAVALSSNKPAESSTETVHISKSSDTTKQADITGSPTTRTAAASAPEAAKAPVAEPTKAQVESAKAQPATEVATKQPASEAATKSQLAPEAPKTQHVAEAAKPPVATETTKSQPAHETKPQANTTEAVKPATTTTPAAAHSAAAAAPEATKSQPARVASSSQEGAHAAAPHAAGADAAKSQATRVAATPEAAHATKSEATTSTKRDIDATKQADRVINGTTRVAEGGSQGSHTVKTGNHDEPRGDKQVGDKSATTKNTDTRVATTHDTSATQQGGGRSVETGSHGSTGIKTEAGSKADTAVKGEAGSKADVATKGEAGAKHEATNGTRNEATSAGRNEATSTTRAEANHTIRSEHATHTTAETGSHGDRSIRIGIGSADKPFVLEPARRGEVIHAALDRIMDRLNRVELTTHTARLDDRKTRNALADFIGQLEQGKFPYDRFQNPHHVIRAARELGPEGLRELRTLLTTKQDTKSLYADLDVNTKRSYARFLEVVFKNVISEGQTKHDTTRPQSRLELVKDILTNATAREQHVVQFGQTLRWISWKSLDDIKLWPLVAKLNGLSLNADATQQTRQPKIGTKLMLPTAEEIAAFRKQQNEQVATTTRPALRAVETTNTKPMVKEDTSTTKPMAEVSTTKPMLKDDASTTKPMLKLEATTDDDASNTAPLLNLLEGYLRTQARCPKCKVVHALTSACNVEDVKTVQAIEQAPMRVVGTSIKEEEGKAPSEVYVLAPQSAAKRAPQPVRSEVFVLPPMFAAGNQ